MSNPTNASPLKIEPTNPSDATVDYVDLAKTTLNELRALHPTHDFTVDISQDYNKQPRAKIEMRKTHVSEPPRSHLPEQIAFGAVGLAALGVAAGYVFSVLRPKPDTK